MRVEEIVIPAVPSEPVEKQRREPRARNAVLEQYNRIRVCKCVFELFNHRFLSVNTEEAFRNAREYELDIGILDPHPKRSLKISWHNLAASLVLAITAGLTGFTDFVVDSFIWPPVLGGCAGLFLILGVYRSRDRLIFYSQNGRIPVVVLFNRNPDRKTFRMFINMLVRKIQEAKDDRGRVNRNEDLNAELREHRRLMEEGIISRNRYDIAKSHILRRHR